ncbi:MAG: hypothetical protein Salg2KO_15780 [Salibacteraceae bacterium]
MLDMANKVSIFRDDDRSNLFKDQGFVVVPFLDSHQIEELQALYSRLYPKGVEGFFSTTFAQNPEHRAEVNSSIRQICNDRMNELLKDYKTFFSSFIVKAPGEKSELILHQDMTLVDERIFTGMNIWCPLIDLQGNNGVLEILPKSHRLFYTYRGSSLPDIYDDVKQEIRKYMQPMPLKAGEAIIFDQSIIHYSPPNLSEGERVVINTFVAHEDAQIRICYHDKELAPDKVQIFAQADNFLEEYQNFGANIFDKPTIGDDLGFVEYDFPKLTSSHLESLYGQNSSIGRRLLNFLKGVS